jgi:hypothetical protein
MAVSQYIGVQNCYSFQLWRPIQSFADCAFTFEGTSQKSRKRKDTFSWVMCVLMQRYICSHRCCLSPPCSKHVKCQKKHSSIEKYLLVVVLLLVLSRPMDIGADPLEMATMQERKADIHAKIEEGVWLNQGEITSVDRSRSEIVEARRRT